MTEGGSYYFYHNDHLGTPQSMTDMAGDIVWEATYEAFGKAQVYSDSTITNNLRFPGQYWDEETGLHWNWHRYYDPGTGRYVSEDPIGFHSGDENFYRYSLNNPATLFDPDGNSSVNKVIVCETNGNLQYGAEAYMFHGNKVSKHPVSIRADNGNRMADGTYYYRVGTHLMSGGRKTSGFNDHGRAYKALNLFSDKQMKNRTIPAAPNASGKKSFSGLNVHAGNVLQKDKCRSKKVGTGSEGCTTIPTLTSPDNRYKKDDMSTWSNYVNVMNEFEKGETGEFIVTSNRTAVLIEYFIRDLMSRW